MLARKKRAQIARERKRLELLRNPPPVKIVVPLREVKRALEASKTPLEARYSHRSSNDVIMRPPEAVTAGNTDLKVTPKYTGDRLLGIAVLHKSCLQPIFSQEEAEAAAKMRRN